MYPLTLELVDFLLSRRAATELLELVDADLGDTLRLVTWLRKRFSRAEAAALLDQAVLRRSAGPRGGGKFPQAERMLFIDEALEQASSRRVAVYRAGVLAAHGVRTVADLGCGIGADTIAMAEAGLRVVAVELDPVRARLTAVNVAAAGLADRVKVLSTDWTTLEMAGQPAVDAAFVDPARRVAGATGDDHDRRRVFSLHEMVPPLSAIRRLRARVPDVLVKVAPGVDLDEVPADAAVTFIAEGIHLKEALLCFGALRPPRSGSQLREAVVLPGPHVFGDDRGWPRARRRFDIPDIRAVQDVFYEPNPAVLRAGLVRDLGRRLHAGQIDPEIAYLTADDVVPTPFARAWPVERDGPFNLKELNRWLREAGVGRVIIKKRGSPIDPDTFRRRLKVTRGGPEKTVFLTQAVGKPWMVLCGDELRVEG
jgi:hypothetical protein